ncbi:MAG TPA: hypothetical protein PLE99_05595 [Candidatus Thiothrix moscowensis]|uniref:hypothetical protein n=1 Tax=unclassified Thiothrix TaxID=2636184 RepID=UPI0025DD86E1|nr:MULTISPECIES: hypothetical protein [unclassified Thiothrix]HRJ52217.1 hypothetical protein [Candidatus Thiothrix moscowensis]HRJ92532.1 hypothetical protein [Candidatus Thiothrix moscowensis]
MIPASYVPPGSRRVGKDGVYVFCCAACKGFVHGECSTHGFTPAKSGRCADYVDVLDNGLTAVFQPSEPDGLSNRGGFESLVALATLRDQLLEEFTQMEQEPLPERYSDALPELGDEIDRLADWLDGQRQWVDGKEGQQRVGRWQTMLERIAVLPLPDRLLLFPLLRGKWERIYASKNLAKDGLHLPRAGRAELFRQIKAAHIMLGRFPPLAVGHWYEATGFGHEPETVSLVSILPLVGMTQDGAEHDLNIDQLGECLTV